MKVMFRVECENREPVKTGGAEGGSSEYAVEGLSQALR